LQLIKFKFSKDFMPDKEIKSTLEDYANAYCSKDIGKLMSVFEDSDNISVIGTGSDELCVGRKEVKVLFMRNFEEATATEFEWNWIDIRRSDNHAVASVTLKIHLANNGANFKVPIRWTVVLKNIGNRWVWIHRNASTAATDQDQGSAYPNKQNENNK
jgi:ketosteroid isomerase-like protein